MDGLLLIDKPEGMTSAEVVRRAKRRLRCKTGHLGTLDPFASGLLPLCVGDGTKIVQFLNTADKEYAGVIRLGSETDSGDLTGAVTAAACVPQLSDRDLERVAEQCTGDSLQTPPMFSAIKQQGIPLYRLARRGVTVEREPRHVRIEALQLRDLGGGAVAFSVSCSKGTYIRVMAQEIAVRLGSLGHLEQLRRTRFGCFRLEETMTLAAVDEAPALPVIGLRESLRHLREIQIDAVAVRRARQGYAPLLEHIPAGRQNEAAKLVGPDGDLASVIVMDGQRGWRFARVFGDAKAGCR